MRKLAWLLLLGSALGQNFMTVTGVSVYGTGNQLLPAGTLLFSPVDANGDPISYQVGGGGQQINFSTVCSVVAGVIQQPCQVANVAVTNPINVCFSVAIKDANNRVILGGPTSGYTCVQPQTTNFWCAGGTCNFDQYVPNLPSAVLAMIAPPKTNSLGAVYAEKCPGTNVVNEILNTGHIACTPGGGGSGGMQDPGANGIMTRIDPNITAIAAPADITATLGYTAANNSMVPHLAGAETISGIKTFLSTIVGSVNGNASTANALTVLPTLCPVGQAPLGILQNGNVTGCFTFASGLGDPGNSGLVKRTTFNNTAVAVGADINAALGYTAANDALTGHLAGAETFNGAKTFSALITGSVSGNAGTASALFVSPTLCPVGQAAQGIAANGNATGCFSFTSGLGDPGANGIIKRTAFNTTTAAVAGDVTATLGYTAANDSLVGHLAGVETFTGAKTFSALITGSVSGNSGTATALSAAPALCAAGQAPRGILASGAATGCAALGIADPGSNGVLKRTALNVSAVAGPSDINGALGYTASNDSLVGHLAGAETFTGVKTFSALVTGSVSGNAGTATALAANPTLCATGSAPTGILASGNATGCAPLGLGDPGGNGIVRRTALNVTAPASGADINTALGYTAASDALVGHLAGAETFTGAKTFSALLTASAALTTTTATATTGLATSLVTNRTGNYLAVSPSGTAAPAGTLVVDAPSGYLQIQADSGAGANLGGVLNLQSSNGPNAIAFASLLVGSSGVQLNAAGMTIFSGGGLKTILTGPGTVQFGNVSGTKGSVDFVGNTSGSKTVACADATCTALAVTGPLTISGTALQPASGGTGVVDFTFSGSTHKALTVVGVLTNGNCVKFDALGNATDAGAPCGSGSGGGLIDPGSNGVLKRTSLNVTAVAGPSDINGALGYTAANDALSSHLAGVETFTGAKTFLATITGSVSGNAGTATALASSPSNCATNSATTGINASGASQGCFTPVLLASDLGNTAAAPRVVATHISGATLNTLMKANATGNMVNSLWADDGTKTTYSGASGLELTGGGSGAGFDGYAFGTAQGVLPGSLGVTVATSGTAHNIVLPGVPVSGFLKFSTTASPAGCTASATVLCGTYAQISLTADVSGILGGANGGTNSAFVTFSGPSGSAKNFTLPNAAAKILTDNADVLVSEGGTGISSGTSGGVLGFTAAGTLASSAALTAGMPVIGGGAGATPTVGTVTGNTTQFATWTGATTAARCVHTDASGNLAVTGADCGTGGGGGVNTGVTPRLAYYDTTATVSSAGNTAIGDGTAAAILTLTGTSLAQPSLVVNCTTPGGNCFDFKNAGSSRIFMDSAGNVSVNGTLRAGSAFVYQNQSAAQTTDYASGLDGNATQGGASFRCGDVTGNGVFTAGNCLLRGGNYTGTGAGTAGNVVIQPGALTNAAPNASAVEGTVTFNAAVMRKGTTVTAGNLACITGDNTISDCGTAATNVRFVGVNSTVAGGSSYVQTEGTATLNLSASSTWTAGDTICTSATSAAQMRMNGAQPCPSSLRQVGFAQVGGTTSTTVKAILSFGEQQIYSTAVATSQTAAIGTTTLLTTGATDALFAIGGSVNCRTAVATATVLLTVNWTDTSNTSQTSSTPNAVCTTLGGASLQPFTQVVNVKAGTAITYSTSVANAPNYDVRLGVKQLTAN